MKDDFLTIPELPNYEVNSEFIVRNKKNGRIPKVHISKKGTREVALRHPDNVYRRRSVKVLRRLALAAVNDSIEFFPVPSLDNNYEISIGGILRNVKTKYRLKLSPSGKYSVPRDGTQTTVSKNMLLLEVFGIFRKGNRLPRPVVITKGDRRIHFDNFRDCARFIAEKHFYAENTIHGHLWRRAENILGWQVTYLDEDQTDYKSSLNKLAHQQRKAEKSLNGSE